MPVLLTNKHKKVRAPENQYKDINPALETRMDTSPPLLMVAFIL